MKLNVLERILLGNMLAGREGNFITLKLIRSFREEISFTEVENKALKFKVEGNVMLWDNTSATSIGEVEFEVGEVVINIIKSVLTELNDKAKLTEQHFSLYEKFFVGDTSTVH